MLTDEEEVDIHNGCWS